MTKLRKNVGAVAETIAYHVRNFKKNCSRDLIGILGSLLLLVFIFAAGIIFWTADKYKQIRTGRA